MHEFTNYFHVALLDTRKIVFYNYFMHLTSLPGINTS